MLLEQGIDERIEAAEGEANLVAVLRQQLLASRDFAMFLHLRGCEKQRARKVGDG